MHVAQLLNAFPFRPNIKVVESLLPNVLRSMVKKAALSGVPVSPFSCQDAAREADFERLHHGRRALLLRFAKEQMNMFRHHHVAHDDEGIPSAHLLQHGQKQVATRCRAQKRLSPITATGDEMQVSGAIKAF